MNDFLWYMFEKSGVIDYYLAYKKYNRLGADANEFGESARNNNS